MSFVKKTGDKIVDSGKKMVGYEDVKDNWSMIKGWLGSLNPKSIKPGRVETFENAYERLGLTEEDLKNVYKSWFLRFYLTLFVFAIGFFSVVYFVLNDNFISLLPFIGFSAICVSQLFASSFRLYQIRSREFVEVSNWFKNKSEWLPLTIDLPEVKKTKKIVSFKKE